MLCHKCIAIGKTGIGGVKRPPSPIALERAAKMVKQSEALSADEFRDRARKEYEDRRAEGKLRHARATCVNLDTKADVKVGRKAGEFQISCSMSLPPVQPVLARPGESRIIPAGIMGIPGRALVVFVIFARSRFRSFRDCQVWAG